MTRSGRPERVAVEVDEVARAADEAVARTRPGVVAVELLGSRSRALLGVVRRRLCLPQRKWQAAPRLLRRSRITHRGDSGGATAVPRLARGRPSFGLPVRAGPDRHQGGKPTCSISVTRSPQKAGALALSLVVVPVHRCSGPAVPAPQRVRGAGTHGRRGQDGRAQRPGRAGSRIVGDTASGTRRHRLLHAAQVHEDDGQLRVARPGPAASSTRPTAPPARSPSCAPCGSGRSTDTGITNAPAGRRGRSGLRHPAPGARPARPQPARPEGHLEQDRAEHRGQSRRRQPARQPALRGRRTARRPPLSAS